LRKGALRHNLQERRSEGIRVAPSGVPPFPRRAIRTSQDAGAAFAVIALAALTAALLPPPQCIEGGTASGRPFSYYSACNGADGKNPLADYSTSALVADVVFWGLVAFGLAHTWMRRRALLRAEATPAGPPGPGPAPPPPLP
jgi:hypothetical protein